MNVVVGHLDVVKLSNCSPSSGVVFIFYATFLTVGGLMFNKKVQSSLMDEQDAESHQKGIEILSDGLH